MFALGPPRGSLPTLAMPAVTWLPTAASVLAPLPPALVLQPGHAPASPPPHLDPDDLMAILADPGGQLAAIAAMTGQAGPRHSSL